LAFGPCSLDEVRIGRHVFERFNRMVILRLLISYERWLKPGRLLLIESPGLVHGIQRRKWGNWRSLVDCCRIALSRKARSRTGNAVAPR
jgi:hypothetical protein